MNNKMEFADVVYGLAWGDEGKGKVVGALAHKYDFVCRWNGGPNAGHTVWVNGKQYKTHLIPSGVFAGKVSVIGAGCVINPQKFLAELEMLKSAGFDPSLVKVSPAAHIITDAHIKWDGENLSHLGTTKQGIAPCYSDKMLRLGKRVADTNHIPDENIWDGKLSGKVLCEGAQSVWLDIDHGYYPFVTSSTTMPYGACSLGFSPRKIRRLIGVAKIYDTKSGTDPLFPDSLREDSILNGIIEEGKEFGTTTGRRRFVNWLNLDRLKDAIAISGCTELIVNKCDILEKVGVFKLINDGGIVQFNSLQEMKAFIVNEFVNGEFNELHDIKWSDSPETI